jgi:hypothetical protein
VHRARVRIALARRRELDEAVWAGKMPSRLYLSHSVIGTVITMRLNLHVVAFILILTREQVSSKSRSKRRTGRVRRRHLR